MPVSIIKRFDSIDEVEGYTISIKLNPKKIYIKVEKAGLAFWTAVKYGQYRLHVLHRLAIDEWESLVE